MTIDPELLTGLGAAAALFFCSLGSALASVQAGKYAMRSKAGVLAFSPIVIAGVLAIYGVIVAVLLSGKIGGDNLNGYRNVSAGLAVGFACLASGLGMAGFLEDSLRSPNTTTVAEGSPVSEMHAPLVPGLHSNSGAKFVMIEPPSVRFLMCMVFIEAIGLYGLIVALILIS